MGWAVNNKDEKIRPRVGVKDLLDAVLKHIPHPNCKLDGELKMLIN